MSIGNDPEAVNIIATLVEYTFASTATASNCVRSSKYEREKKLFKRRYL